MQQRAANEPVKMDEMPVRYGKGLKPRTPTMQGILGKSDGVTVEPTPLLDEPTKREISAKREHIRELSNANREMLSSKIKTETLGDFTEKKSNARLAKYINDRDNLAALALKNAKERQTKHLKRDEVAAKTAEL